jgi:hypothetical protein
MWIEKKSFWNDSSGYDNVKSFICKFTKDARFKKEFFFSNQWYDLKLPCHVRYEVFTVVTMKNAVFWDVYAVMLL